MRSWRVELISGHRLIVTALTYREGWAQARAEASRRGQEIRFFSPLPPGGVE